MFNEKECLGNDINTESNEAIVKDEQIDELSIKDDEIDCSADNSSEGCAEENSVLNPNIFKRIFNWMNNLIFFRSKKNIIITVLSIALIFGMVAILKFGCIKIAENTYNLFKEDNITYEEAIKKISVFEKFADVSTFSYKCSALNDSRIAYAKAMKYENNSYWYHAYEGYSNVIELDDNYANAQAKLKTIKQKILQSTNDQLKEYKISNDFENALQLIDKTEKYVQDDTLNNYKDYFLKQQSIAEAVNFEYNHGPFTLYKLYSSGDVMYSTYIETFNITEATKMRSGKIQITCEVSGVVSGSDYCNFKIKCYNDKGFIIESVNVFESVASNEPFKIVDEVYIPADTVKIDFVAD